MGVRQGESREEANRHAAVLALTAPVSDPVVTAVMRLFRPPAQARDGIAFARRTPAQELPSTSRPVEAGLAIIPRTWDNRNRSCFRALSLSGSREDARLGREPFSFLLNFRKKDNSARITAEE